MSFSLLSRSLSLVLALLAALHIYWCFGGRRGSAAAIPTDLQGAAVLHPGRASTLLVAFLLACAAYFVLVRSPWTAAIGLVFLARVVGDFRYFGLFKKITGTPFARMDSLVYTPICLLISLGCFALFVQKAGVFGRLAIRGQSL
jgi:hypothetical protein